MRKKIIMSTLLFTLALILSSCSNNVDSSANQMATAVTVGAGTGALMYQPESIEGISEQLFLKNS